MRLKSRASKCVAIIFAALVLAGLIALVLLVSYRTELATWALRQVAADLPLEDAEFQVVALEVDSCEIEIVRLVAPGWQINKGRIVATYSLGTLWDNHALDSLTCSDFDGRIDLATVMPSSPRPTEPMDSADIDAVLESISTEIQSRHIPLGRFDLNSSTFLIVNGSQSETVALTAHFETEAQSLIAASVELDAPSGNGQLTCTVLPESDMRLQLTAQFDTPMQSLDRWKPDWPTLLNLGAADSITADSIGVHAVATGRLADLPSILAHADVTISSLTVAIAGNATKASNIEFKFNSSSTNDPQLLSLTVTSDRIESQLDDYQITGNALQLAITTARAQPFEWIDVSALSTIDVSNQALPLHLISAVAVTAGASVESPLESLIVECTLKPSLLEVKQQRIAPSHIELSANAHGVNVLIPELRLNQAALPYLTNTRLNLAFADPFSPSTATLQTTIGAQEAWPVAPLLSTSELELEATLNKVAPNSIELTALLTNTPQLGKFNLRYADLLQLEGNPQIKLNASALDDGSQWHAQLGIDLNDAQLEAAQVKLSGLKASFATNADQTLHLPAASGLDNAALQRLLTDLEGSLTWEADSLSRAPYELGWPAGDIALKDGLFRLSLEGSQLKTATPVTPRRLAFELTAPFTNWPQTTAQVQLDTQIDGKPLALSGTLQGDVSDVAAGWDFDAAWAPFELEYSDIVGRLIPEAVGLSVTGMISGELNGTVSPSAWDAQLATRITGGSIDLPASQIKADGIEGVFTVDSLQAFTSAQPASNRLEIERIEVGGLLAANTQLAWSWLSSDSIYLDTVQTSLFGGSLALAPSALKLSPFDIDSQIRVTGLSLYELGEFLDLFDGSLEGAIEGVIPFTFRNNIFLPKSTQLQLPEQTQAKLRYASEALKQSLATESPYVLKSLKLEPSTLITDALSDLTITEFQVTLFSRETPEVPLTIHIAGHGLSGKTEVPLILDIPIKGSLEELYILLLRLHTKARPK